MSDLFINRIVVLGTWRFSFHSNRCNWKITKSKLPDDFSLEHTLIQERKGLLEVDVSLSSAVIDGFEAEVLARLSEDQATWPIVLCVQQGGPAGSRAQFLTAATVGAYLPTGSRGEIYSCEVPILNQGDHCRGLVLCNSIGTAGISAPETGVGIDLGTTVGPGQEALIAYCPLQPPLRPIGSDGTLDGVIQTDVDDNWPAPVDRLNLPQINDVLPPDPAAGFLAHLLRIDGDTDPVSPHTWWRVKWTAVGGIGTRFFVLLVITIRNKAG